MVMRDRSLWYAFAWTAVVSLTAAVATAQDPEPKAKVKAPSTEAPSTEASSGKLPSAQKPGDKVPGGQKAGDIGNQQAYRGCCQEQHDHNQEWMLGESRGTMDDKAGYPGTGATADQGLCQ